MTQSRRNPFFPSKAALAALLATTSALGMFCSSEAQPLGVQRVPYEWKNVTIGGAVCWVTGVVVHPKAPHNTYIRTDIGGAFRWDEDHTRWIPLNDQFTVQESEYYGMESLALDPNQPDWLYMAAGRYTASHEPKGVIFKSTNRGQTWTKLNLTLPMGGNEHGRQGGERLAVSPTDSKVLLFGSRTQGLWRTGDGGDTWQQIATNIIPLSKPLDNVNYGVSALAFHPTTSGLVYACVTGHGVYRSTDSGITWTLLPDSPLNVWRFAVSEEGTLWATHRNGVAKYVDGSWSNFTPGGKPDTYIALAINPRNSNDVFVSDLGEKHRAPDGGRLYRTLDGGMTWNRVPAVRNSMLPWVDNRAVVNVSALAFDYSNLNHVWAADWFGISRINDLNTQPLVLRTYEKGHEQSVPVVLASPRRGPELVSGFLDLNGFIHNRGLDEPPFQAMQATPTWMAATTSIAYCEADPSHMVRTGSQGARMQNATLAVSADGGITWKTVTGYATNQSPFRVAMSATDHQNMVVMSKQATFDEKTKTSTPVPAPWQFTKDGGATWTPCIGLPAHTAFSGYSVFGTTTTLAADTVAGGTFYIYAPADGKLYRSTDGGANFNVANASNPLPPGSFSGPLRTYRLKTEPGAKGYVWAGFSQHSDTYRGKAPLAQEGLYCSPDGGAIWKKIPTVESVRHFAFGKPAPNQDNATLFLYGRLKGDTTDKIYRSVNSGTEWQNITDSNNPIGNQPTTMEGSRQTFGRVFIGTNGRGIFYGDELTQH